MNPHLIIGGPGAGKTERLLNIMDQALDKGTPPERIAFVSFTNAAVDEARMRAQTKFSLAADALPYLRTLHSLCFRELGLRSTQIVTLKHLEDLGALTGELITTETDLNADPLLTLDHFARTTLCPLKTAWEMLGSQLDIWRVERFAQAYRLFKEAVGLIDFTDMLSNYVTRGAPVPVDIAIVDEAQDLTPLQWQVVGRAFAHVKELYVGGDDLQAIHQWSGADSDHFLNLPYPREILSISHRLPTSIFNLSEEIAARITTKFAKHWQPAGTRQGHVVWHGSSDDVPLARGTWLLLARTHYHLAPLVQAARDQGALYIHGGKSSVDIEHVTAIRAYEALRAGRAVDAAEAGLVLKFLGRKVKGLDPNELYNAAMLGGVDGGLWHDALVKIPIDTREYYLACLRRGEKLTAPPRVRIETIHGAKGLQAQNVLLMTDTTYRVQRGFEANPDPEHRVFYVGVTRASEALHLVMPQGEYFYQL